MPEISFFWLSVNHSGNVYSALDIFAYEQVFQIQESFCIPNDRVELTEMLLIIPFGTNSSG